MGRIKIAVFALLGLLVVGGGIAAYLLLHVEEIPEELELPGDPTTLSIPGIGQQEDLDVAKLAGKRAFFVFVGIQSWSSDEGKKLNRALNRWKLPDDTVGYIVFDAEGLGFLQEKSAEYMDKFAAETRYSMYGDFEGAFRGVFKLPRGHHGFVIVDGDGTIAMRHSGGFSTDEEIEEVRALLQAEEPPPGPQVPDFEVGAVSDEACAEHPCALLFLGKAVDRGDIPGIEEGGFEGEDDARWAQFQKPDVRNVSSVLKLALEGEAKGLVIGETGTIEFAPGWSTTSPDETLRQMFDVSPEDTSFLVLRDGRVAFRGDGVIPFYQWGIVADVMGVEFEFEE